MFIKLLILFMCGGIVYPICADMKIAITSGVNASCPIAIIPFTFINKDKLVNTLGNNIDSIIASDLNNSGKFNTVPVSYFPNYPSKVSDVIPMFWGKLGINMIVLGSIDIHHDDNYMISYQLIDAGNNPALVILENQYLVEKRWIRSVAHTISNEIFEKLTGIKGVFCTRIAYITYTNRVQYPYELCISDYDGYNQISICQSFEPLMSPAWSPDGKKLAYVTFASGRSELVIQNLSTGIISNIINFPNHNGAPAFSPDGKKLAFCLSKTGSLNLYIMDLKSGKISQLTANRYNNTEPSWFPDNQHLAYTSDQGGTPQVYKININNIDCIERLSWIYDTNCSPSVSVDGTFLIMVSRSQGKQNISKLNLLNGKEELLTKSSFLSDTPTISPNNSMILYSTIVQKKTSKTMINNQDNNNESVVLKLISVDGQFKARLKVEGSSEIENIRFPTWSPLLTCS